MNQVAIDNVAVLTDQIQSGEKRTRARSIDNLKGVAILGVVWAHMAIGGEEVLRATQAALGWCVIAFFWASGALRIERRRRGDAKEWVIRRARRLLIPAVAFFLLNNVAIFVLTRSGIITSLPSDVDFKIFLTTNLSPQIYFLVYLFSIELVARAIPGDSSIIGFVLFVLVGFLLNIYYPSPMPYGSHFSNIPFYLAAYVLPDAWARVEDRNRLRWGIVMGLVALFALVTSGIYIGFFIFVPPLLAWLLPERSIPILTQVGVCSGAIFIWHAPIISSAVQRFTPSWARGSYAMAWLAVATIVAASALLGKVVNRIRWLKPWDF